MHPILAMGDLATPVLFLVLLTVDGILAVVIGLLALSLRKRSLVALVIASILVLIDGYMVIMNMSWASDAFLYPLTEDNYKNPDLIFWCRVAVVIWLLAVSVATFYFVRVIQARLPKKTISNTTSPSHRLAVCSWSLQPANPQELVAKLNAIGITRVQLALDPLRETPAVWGDIAKLFAQAGITIVSGMFGCVGEDYSTLDSIRETGGIVPDATWKENLQNIQATADIAADLGLKLVTFHAGFVPHDSTDVGYAKMLQRLAAVAEIFAVKKMDVALETGQETAHDLAALLNALQRPNVGVNFDPANMLLYGKGDPIQAVRLLGPWIRQVHIKDATQTKVPGTWGAEVPVGTGEVNWPAFFAALAEINYAGDLVIEREAGTQRVADIRTAREVVLKFVG